MTQSTEIEAQQWVSSLLKHAEKKWPSQPYMQRAWVEREIRDRELMDAMGAEP